MAILRRGSKVRREKHNPEVVTGSFELHYEDVVGRNRFAIVALFTVGLVLLAAFIPNIADRSTADREKSSAEAENGLFINAELIKRVTDDLSANGNGYLEFSSPHVQNTSSLE